MTPLPNRSDVCQFCFVDGNPHRQLMCIAVKLMKQDTGKSRKNTKDQFYTLPNIADACVAKICETVSNATECLWIEPAAGGGSFLQAVPPSCNRIGVDVEPKSDDVIKRDYLLWEPPDTTQDIIVFGNPPFGRRSSLAKSFIVRSCRFAKVIAFILPRSFVKPSMFNAFSPRFHMIYNEKVPKDAFIVNEEAYDVPCVFQIWEKRDIDRPAASRAFPVGYEYVKQCDDFHIAFRRVGALAGKCYPNDGRCFNSETHYFIRIHSGHSSTIDDVILRINNHIFPSNTVGPRSISKPEACEVINHILLEHT